MISHKAASSNKANEIPWWTRLPEVGLIVNAQLIEGDPLCLRKRQHILSGIISVDFEVVDGSRTGTIRASLAVKVTHDQSSSVQIVCCEIRTKICTMAEDRPVLHQAVTQEDLLAFQNVGPREE